MCEPLSEIYEIAGHGDIVYFYVNDCRVVSV